MRLRREGLIFGGLKSEASMYVYDKNMSENRKNHWYCIFIRINKHLILQRF